MDFQAFQTEAECKAAGIKSEAEIKAQRAADTAADKRAHAKAIIETVGPPSYQCVQVKKH